MGFAYHCSLLRSQYNPAIYTIWIVLEIKNQLFLLSTSLQLQLPSQQLHPQFIAFSNQENGKFGLLFLLFTLNFTENRNGAIERLEAPLQQIFLSQTFNKKQDYFAWQYCLSDGTVLPKHRCYYYSTLSWERTLAWALYLHSCFGTGLDSTVNHEEKKNTVIYLILERWNSLVTSKIDFKVLLKLLNSYFHICTWLYHLTNMPSFFICLTWCRNQEVLYPCPWRHW